MVPIGSEDLCDGRPPGTKDPDVTRKGSGRECVYRVKGGGETKGGPTSTVTHLTGSGVKVGTGENRNP